MQHRKKLLGGDHGSVDDILAPVDMHNLTLQIDVTAGWSVKGLRRRTTQLVAISVEDSDDCTRILEHAAQQLAILRSPEATAAQRATYADIQAAAELQDTALGRVQGIICTDERVGLDNFTARCVLYMYDT